MKYWQILSGGILLALLLFLAACSSQPTQDQTQVVKNDTPTNLGTERKPVETVPSQTIPAPEPVINVSTPAASTTPKVSVTSLDVFGSRFDATKYVFNQIMVNFTTDRNLDLDKMSIYVGNKYYNATYSYNDSISCTKTTDLIKNRKSMYAANMSSTSGSICLSPARDMSVSETLSLVGTYDGTVVLNEKIMIPSSVASTHLHLK